MLIFALFCARLIPNMERITSLILIVSRSDSICTETASSPREQFNGITAFIDGSNIYGSDEATSSGLREFSDGLLKTHNNTAFTVDNLPMRSQCPFPVTTGHQADLTAGDVRAVVQPTLASMHTLFLNEHNRIATALKPELISQSPSFAGFSSAGQDNALFEVRTSTRIPYMKVNIN